MTFRPLGLAVTLVAGCGLLAPLALAEGQRRAVSLFAVVEAANGSYVSGLGRSDFVVEGDAGLAIEDVTRVSEGWTLQLLVDTTESFLIGTPDASFGGRNPLSLIGRFAEVIDEQFLRRLGADDQVQIGRLGATLVLEPLFRPGRAEKAPDLRRLLQVSSLDLAGPSRIWDGTLQAIETIESRPAAVILLTDGEATGNRRRPADVALAALARGVPIHVMSEGGDGTFPQSAERGIVSTLVVTPRTNLRYLAEQTGGLFREGQRHEAERLEGRLGFGYDSRGLGTPLASRSKPLPRYRAPDPNWTHAGEALADIASSLRQTYRVTLSTDALGRDPRPLQLRTVNPQLRVHAPRWYQLP